MAFINYTAKNLAIKIVYYGPGLSGKTTNLRYIYFKLDTPSRGDLICLETDTERTYFFDLLPIKAGLIGDFKVHFQLMTVPGQVFYEASRKNVLKGADGIVFVGDSQIPLLDANLESFDGLRRNLLEQNVDLNLVPLVFQYNKRDLEHLIPVETFNNLLNPRKLPYIEASALNGVGVFEALREIAKLTVPIVRGKLLGEKRRAGEELVFDQRVEEAIEEKPEEKEEKKEEVEFVPPAAGSPIKLTKVRIKSHEEIEKEIERLSEEFTSKTKE
jgi:GTPase SAR1 family protein